MKLFKSFAKDTLRQIISDFYIANCEDIGDPFENDNGKRINEKTFNDTLKWTSEIPHYSLNILPTIMEKIRSIDLESAGVYTTWAFFYSCIFQKKPKEKGLRYMEYTLERTVAKREKQRKIFEKKAD